MLSMCRITQYELSNVLIQRLYAEPYTRSNIKPYRELWFTEHVL